MTGTIEAKRSRYRGQCLFCASRECHFRVYREGTAFDEVACDRCSQLLDRYAIQNFSELDRCSTLKGGVKIERSAGNLARSAKTKRHVIMLLRCDGAPGFRFLSNGLRVVKRLGDAACFATREDAAMFASLQGPIRKGTVSWRPYAINLD